MINPQVATRERYTVMSREEKESNTESSASTQQLADWCERLRNSDHRAYEEIFRMLYDPLLNYAVYLTKSRPVALDIIQDAFLKLWEKRTTLNPDKSVKALLYLIVRNLAFNHNRDTASRAAKLSDPIYQPLPNEPGPEETFKAGELKEKLDGWIDSLPIRQREALVLSRMQGLSHDEIASVMDVSPRTVNNHIVRALKYIHGKVQGYEPTLLKS